MVWNLWPSSGPTNIRGFQCILHIYACFNGTLVTRGAGATFSGPVTVFWLCKSKSCEIALSLNQPFFFTLLKFSTLAKRASWPTPTIHNPCWGKRTGLSQPPVGTPKNMFTILNLPVLGTKLTKSSFLEGKRHQNWWNPGKNHDFGQKIVFLGWKPRFLVKFWKKQEIPQFLGAEVQVFYFWINSG